MTFILEDRAGPRRSPSWPTTSSKFKAAARQRKEVAAVSTTISSPPVPQVYIQVDRDKALKAGRGDLNDVYQDAAVPTWAASSSIISTASGRRQWQVYVEAEGQYRDNSTDALSGQYYVRNQGRGPWSP